ncbi:MAG: MFS transporter [Pseudomonadota bacterium]
MITTGGLIGYALAEQKALATLPIAIAHLATMLTSFPASLLMAKIGRKAGFLLAALVGGLAGVLATWGIIEGEFWWFCLASVGFGFFTSFGHYYRFTAAEVVEPSYKSRAISYVMAGGVLAALAGPNLANISQAWISDARFAGSYAALIGLYILSGILVSLTVIPKPAAETQADSGRSLLTIASQGRFAVACLCATLGYATMALVMTATPLAMSDHEFSFGDVAFVIQCHVLGMFVPSFFTGHLIKRFGCANIMLWGGAALSACVLINLSGHSLWHYWSALVLLGIAWNFLYVGGTTMLTDTYTPGEKARAQGLNDVIVFSTVTIAALSAGVLQQTVGWERVNSGVVPAIAIVFASLIWLKMTKRESPAAAA